MSRRAPVFRLCPYRAGVRSNFVASGSSCRQTNTATWTATDACGNSASRSQTIILVDTTAPGVTTPQGNDATNQGRTAFSFNSPQASTTYAGVTFGSYWLRTG